MDIKISEIEEVIREVFEEEDGVVNSVETVYEMSTDEKFLKLDGYYRTGHYHWGYEGYLLSDIDPNVKYDILLAGGIADDTSFEEDFVQS
jgi:hypothetical protein